MTGFVKVCILGAVLFGCLFFSGCATLLGGIIGHQSGEGLAGAAIGAGFDFGGGIIEGVGWLLTDKETRFEQKVSLDSEAGSIVLAKSDYSSEKVEKLIRRLEKKFEENGWSHTLVQKKMKTGKTLFSERWLCKNVDGSEFELSILQEKCKDTRISIGTVSEQAINKSAITIEIYNWLKQAALI